MKGKLGCAILFGIVVGGAFAAEIEPGLDWQYKGSKHYDKALVVWTDRGLIPYPADPLPAIEASRNAVLELLLKPDSDVAWSAIKPVAVADRGLGVVVAEAAIPTNVIQRITHKGLYLFERQGWGFSFFANLDAEGNVTEFALNDINQAGIESRLIFTDGITIKDVDLKAYTMPSSAVIAGQPCRTAVEIVDNLERCRQQDGFPSAAGSVLSTNRLEQALVREWLKAQAGELAACAEPLEEEGLCRLRIAKAPCVCAHRVEEIKPNAELKLSVIEISNAVAGFVYDVLETDDLSKPFVPGAATNIVADANGKLRFEVPVQRDRPNRFYRIRVSGNLD